MAKQRNENLSAFTYQGKLKFFDQVKQVIPPKGMDETKFLNNFRNKCLAGFLIFFLKLLKGFALCFTSHPSSSPLSKSVLPFPVISMASSSRNPIPRTAFEDEESLIHETDDQTLQQVVDQFVRVDTFNSLPVSCQAPVTVDFNHPTISRPASLPHTTIPQPIMTDSVTIHVDKGKSIVVSPNPSPQNRGSKARPFTRQTAQVGDSVRSMLKRARAGVTEDAVIGAGNNVPLSASNWILGVSQPTLLHPIDPSNAFEYHNAQKINFDGLSVPVSKQLSHHPQSFSVQGFYEDSTTLFVDAALDHNKGLTGIGFALQIGPRRIITSQNHLLPGASTHIFTEGQALLQGISWCIASHLKPDFMFFDCQNLVSKVNGVWKDNSGLSGLVSQIRLLFSNFPDASLLHLPGQYNTMTHSLVKEALRLHEEAHREFS
ncbi:hypothetical protein G4B88_003393 [Cannabis sativa]|uniref:RNase H type-1 domain-containing protein n=1 Tax=Cannabis sativa TaxID=3483 RepID=A0A7J6E4F5_CANSA|nr:hypothetical protein G4B88_003393 [Cannabis sativa]